MGLHWDKFVAMNKGWKPGAAIEYISPEIPQFEVTEYKGERYETMVPDTLDLAERALTIAVRSAGIHTAFGSTCRKASSSRLPRSVMHHPKQAGRSS